MVEVCYTCNIHCSKSKSNTFSTLILFYFNLFFHIYTKNVKTSKMTAEVTYFTTNAQSCKHVNHIEKIRS